MIELMDDTATPELAPPVALSSGPLGVVQAADREIARLTAVRVRAVAEFAASRPASADRAPGEPGAMSAERWSVRPELLRPVSEWAAQELSVALSITTNAAETMLERSLTLVQRLPGTLAALEGGALHAGHLFPMLDKVAPIADDRVRAEVEASLLRWAAGRVTTPAQLSAKARREVLRRDARAAARQLERALAERGVFWSPDRVDGMGSVTAALTLPESRALIAALGACADALEDEPGNPTRTREQKMADCLLDLVLRPGECGSPPVQVQLTLVASVATALGGDAPGEVDGHPVPAEMVRGLLRGLTGADLTHPDRELEPEPEFGLPDPDEYAAYVAAEHDFALWQEEFERRITAGEFAHDLDAGWYDPDESDLAGAPPQAATALPASATAPRMAATAGRSLVDDRPATVPEPDDWWTQADRAVDAAGRRLWEAQEAVAHAGAMVRTAAASDAGDEAAWQAGPGGRLTAAEDTMTALAAAATAQREELGRLLGTTGGGGPGPCQMVCVRARGPSLGRLPQWGARCDRDRRRRVGLGSAGAGERPAAA